MKDIFGFCVYTVTAMDRFGTLRKMRTAIFGPPKTAGDAFVQTRDEIVKYRKVIGAFQKTVDRFEKEIRSMHDVHENLSNEIKTFEFRDSEHVRRFSDALDKMTTDLRRFEVAGLRHKINEKAGELEQLAKLVEKRDDALAEKIHFDHKVAKLTDEKKKDRNDAKHEAAIAKYAELDQKVILESKNILARREQVIQDLVLEYMQAYQKLFNDLQQTFSKASSPNVVKARGRTMPVPSAPVLEDTFSYS